MKAIAIAILLTVAGIQTTDAEKPDTLFITKHECDQELVRYIGEITSKVNVSTHDAAMILLHDPNRAKSLLDRFDGVFYHFWQDRCMKFYGDK